VELDSWRLMRLQRTLVRTAGSTGARVGGPDAFHYVWLLLGIFTVGAGICGYWWPVPISPLTIGCLLGLSLAAEFLRRREFGRETSGGVMAVALAAAVPLVGPVGAAAIGILPSLAIQPKGTPRVARYFNAVQQGLIGLTGGVVYLAIGGRTTFDGTASVGTLLGEVLLPLLVATGVMLVVNALLLGGVVRFAEGVSVRATFWATVDDARLVYFGYGVVSFLFVVLWQVEGLGPLSLLLVIAPLLLAQWSISGHAEEREAQQRTLHTLVAAVETRGAQRRGQSERVAEVCAAVGEALRLSPARAEALQFAAAVHNVGLITPPESSAPGEGLTVERIQQHPARGVAMLEGIDFLDESRSAIAHHHERWDGAGYPDGLAGKQIPLLARIVAVGDLYVALTWGAERAAPARALAIVEERAGTQLDPACVAALRLALERGRIAAVPPPDGPDLVVDHDAPAVADRVGREDAC
jgi:HD domain